MRLARLWPVAFLLLSTVAVAAPASTAPSAPTWEKTLERVVPAVVSLRVTATRDFDTERAGSSQGTGFVVDRERGIILTNRHMVHAGPVQAEAVFNNQEEVPLRALYRDPVHDFGLYGFDPKDVKYLDLAELDLAPDAARVGMEIRVIGNDAGEKISILDGTLARLDRAAPAYGGDTYNDFNTFYLQAASNTSGGSSGSPVVGIDGRVVGLNAGGRVSSAQSFYLPLDRVVRALDLVQRGEPVARGTLQTTFEHTPYDELGRLGLRAETEATVRKAFPGGTGMLVVRDTVPDGPGWDELVSGDVVVRVNGALVTTFVPLEAVLDDHVGDTVHLELERGGLPVTLDLAVQDLHAITPDAWLEMGRGVFNATSYHQARNKGVAVKGVYVTQPGYSLGLAGMPRGAVIERVDGRDIATLDDLYEAFTARPDRSLLRVRYHRIEREEDTRELGVQLDRVWYPIRLCRWDASTGDWPCKTAPDSGPPEPVAPTTVQMPEPPDDKAGKRLAAALVMVDFDIPYPTSGVKAFNYRGAGVIVDAERGLVVADRDTVPVTLGDVTLTFGGAVRVPATVVYLHPVHDFAVLHYDPAALGDTPIRAAELSSREVHEGDKVHVVGLNSAHQVVASATRVSRIKPLSLGLSNTPRFRDGNVEGFDVGDSPQSMGGVVTDAKGRVLALWASFYDQQDEDSRFYGLPTRYLRPILDPLRRGEEVHYRWLGAELWPISLADAHARGLADARFETLLQADPRRRQVLEVLRTMRSAPAGQALLPGDLVLELAGEPLTRLSQLEALHDDPSVDMLILRDGEEQRLRIATVELDGRGVDRLVSWAGLLAHEPHFDALAQRGVLPGGVYITWHWYGSPASQYEIRPTRRILAVDDTPTPTLEAFVAAVQKLASGPDHGQGQPVRVRLETLERKIVVQTLKLDTEYWPTRLIERVDGQWTARDL